MFVALAFAFAFGTVYAGGYAGGYAGVYGADFIIYWREVLRELSGTYSLQKLLGEWGEWRGFIDFFFLSCFSRF
ncbi:hypothetical protein BZA05DRAFT_396510 [Tricharina praecox]|uniref:uncharacterized protein n=1 Tax=Tricharina praecox TaxID=43433 RepID=UPI00222125D7|nr:uncharacterized protein BZA05DRAFT_396510 [Tricharina praecox]KAI5853561.1 hypothetical protein BZA05DRAFT_396510 [Tricharina praecox]